MFRPRRILWGAVFVALVTVLSPALAAGVTPSGHGTAAAPLGKAPVVHGTPASTVPAPLSAAALQRAATQQRILSTIHSTGAPMKYAYLPNFNPQVTTVNNVTTPSYLRSPAPIGVAAYGVINTTGVAKAQVYDTPSFQGQLTVNGADNFYLDDDSTDYFGAQLNTILTNVTLLGNSSYTFWTQNVISWSGRSDLLQFVDNIWNFSSPQFNLTSNVFNQTSPNGTQVGNAYYYGLGPVVNITAPFTLELYNNASITNIGGLPYSEIWYNYSVYKSGSWVVGGSYDWAIFDSQNVSAPTATIPAPVFQVNGGKLTPTGFIPYDAELVLCGPGGGSTTSFNSLNATENLWWWNASASSYENVPSAMDFGSETGETAEGATAWWDPSGTVHLTTGPTIPVYFWNMSPTATPGYMTVNGTVSPSTAFVFLNQSSNLSVPIDENWAAWVPVPPSGVVDWQLSPGNYVGEILMSSYDPMTFVLNQSNASTWDLNGVLNPDPFQGIYTPLIAFDDAQVAWLSTSGDGSLANPYQIMNSEFGALDPIFGMMNDYGFPVFPGILLAHTTVHVDINSPASFLVNYDKRDQVVTGAFGLPPSNNLQIELYGTRYVSIHGGSDITGWFSTNQQGFPLASVLIWNSTNALIAGNVFESQGSSLLFFGGAGNTVSGNWFLQSSPGNVLNGFYPYGLTLYESGDLIYNNYFAVDLPALSPHSSPYTETFYSIPVIDYYDTWNVSLAPATWVNVVNGYSLSGSIVGGTWQGGNYWWNWVPGSTVPFNDTSFIFHGGDYLPLDSPTTSAVSALTFTASGVPTNTVWTVWVNGVAESTGGTTILLDVANGTYTFAVSPISGLVATPSSGAVTVSGAAANVAIAFAAPPSAAQDIEFIENGLPAGTTWTVTLAGTAVPSTLSTIIFHEPNGTYPYSVGSVTGYKSNVGNGNATVSGKLVLVDVTFAGEVGTISGTVNPSSAQVWVDGVSVPVASSGAFSASVAPGLHAVEVTANGYYPVFDNVSVTAASVTPLTIALHGVTSSASGLLSGSNGAIVAVLAVLLVIFFIGMVYFASRRPPMMMKPEPADK